MNHIAPTRHTSPHSFVPWHTYDAAQHASLPSVSARQEKELIEIVAPPKRRRGRPAKLKTNLLKPYLQGIKSPGHALSILPGFDNIVTGAVNTDFGSNTRPLSKKLVITLLQRLDVISSKAVLEYMNKTLRMCCVRHAQKIVQCLGVVHNAAIKVARTQWPAPDEAGLSASCELLSYIEPCGNDTCAICCIPTPKALTESGRFGGCKDEEDKITTLDDDLDEVGDWHDAD